MGGRGDAQPLYYGRLAHGIMADQARCIEQLRILGVERTRLQAWLQFMSAECLLQHGNEVTGAVAVQAAASAAEAWQLYGADGEKEGRMFFLGQHSSGASAHMQQLQHSSGRMAGMQDGWDAGWLGCRMAGMQDGWGAGWLNTDEQTRDTCNECRDVSACAARYRCLQPACMQHLACQPAVQHQQWKAWGGGRRERGAGGQQGRGACACARKEH